MRVLLTIAVSLVLLSVVPAHAQDAGVDYSIEIDKRVSIESRGDVRYVTVRFRLKRSNDQSLVTDLSNEEVVVEEDGHRVASEKLAKPRSDKLTVVLAMDISGSMARANKIEEARRAALHFLEKLDPHASAGLITFDHQIRVAEPPSSAPAHRERLKQLVRDAKPQGGTAYLDATVAAANMLKEVKGQKVIVLMTDGVDMNSKSTLDQAILAAQSVEVPVYTVGIGEPGKNVPVTTVLVLDHSGSMNQKAEAGDKVKKIDALKLAADRFVDLMRPEAQTTLIPFSSRVETPKPFTNDKKELKNRIKILRAMGATLLYDATYRGIETLVAGAGPGKHAVIVMTDGKDEGRPGSRHSDQAVIERAKEAKIPLYMLGLGQKREIAEDVMKNMAEQTGGQYYHAGNQQRLIEIFENLSIELHDDGIDEKSLSKLAEDTGGRYTHVKNFSDLKIIYEQLAGDLQSTFSVTYPSRRPTADGTARGIDVKVLRKGVLVSTVGKVDDVARGVVVPSPDARVYLGFLLVLGLMLTFPSLIRRVYRGFGGT
jgi:VWFA-related protein